MAGFTTTIQVASQHEPRQLVEIQVEVATGRRYTAVQRKTLEELGVLVARVETETMLHGSTRTIEVGEAAIIVAGREFTATVSFAEEGEPCILGYLALKQAQAIVDPVNKRLIPSEGKY